MDKRGFSGDSKVSEFEVHHVTPVDNSVSGRLNDWDSDDDLPPEDRPRGPPSNRTNGHPEVSIKPAYTASIPETRQTYPVVTATSSTPTHPNAFIGKQQRPEFKIPSDLSDFQSDNALLEQRGGRDIVTTAHSGDPVRLKWPFRLLTHDQPVELVVQFSCVHHRLSEITNSVRYRDDSPLALDPHVSRIGSALNGQQDIGLPGYDFAPHSMSIVEYSNTGVPEGWFAQLRTIDHEDAPVDWFQGGYIPGHEKSPVDTGSFHLLADRSERLNCEHVVFGSDTNRLGSETWMRWATMSYADVMRDLHENHEVSSGLYYHFHLGDVHATQAEHPVVHAALRNLGVLWGQAVKDSAYPKLTIADMLQPNTKDGGADLYLPISPTNEMIRVVFANIDQQRTLMRFSKMKMLLFPERGMGLISEWQDARSKSTPAYIHNPFINVSVCVRLRGVFIRKSTSRSR